MNGNSRRKKKKKVGKADNDVLEQKYYDETAAFSYKVTSKAWNICI